MPRSQNILESVAAPLVGTSDEQGTVTLGLGAAARYLVVLDHPDVAPLVVVDDEARTTRLRPSSGERLRVKIEAPPGAAVPAGRICAHWVERLPILDRERPWQRCSSGTAQELLEIAGVPRRELQLVAQFPGFLATEQSITPGKEPALVSLRPGVLLSGVVKDSRGAPIQRASVRAPAGLETASGNDGAFELTVAALPVELTAEAEGYVATSFAVAPGKASGLDLRLPRATALLATLLSSRPDPLGSVVVRVERRAAAGWSGSERRVAVGSRGELVLPIAERGQYRIKVRAPSHREWVSPVVEVEEGTRADLGIVRLSAGGVVRGRVVAAATGEPVPEVDVSVVARATGLLAAALRGEAIAHTVSAADGSFELPGLEIASYEVRLEHPRFALTTATAEVSDDVTVELGTIALDAGLVVGGRVVDRQDRGLPDVRVEVLAAGRNAEVPVTQTTCDRQGRFRLQPLAAGPYLLRAFGRRLLVSQEVSLEPAGAESPVILVSDGVAVKGRIHRRGEPVGGGSVVLQSMLDPTIHRGTVIVRTGGGLAPGRQIAGDASTEVSAVVDPAGIFAASEVNAGPVRLTFLSASGDAVEREVTVPDLAESWLEVDVGGVPLAGRVFDGGTQRGIAATLTLARPGRTPLPKVQAADDGSFLVADLAAGQYRLEAAAPGYEPRVLIAEVADGMAPLSISLEPGGASAFEVRLSRPSGPAALVPVALLDAHGAMAGSLLTDFDGHTRFAEISDGRYALVWADPLGGVGSSGWLSVGDQSRSFARTLTPGSDVRLACESASCGGALATLLQMYDASGVEIGRYLPGLFGARFSVQGTLSIGRLAPGRYTVVVDVGGRRLQGALAVQEGGAALDLDLDG